MSVTFGDRLQYRRGMPLHGFDFQPNPDFERNLKRDLDAKAQLVIDTVTAWYRADDTRDLRADLAHGLAQQGINLDPDRLEDWAAAIENDEEVRADIRIV